MTFLLIVRFIVLELASYGPYAWVGFISLTILLARTLGRPGIFLGHLLILAAVCALDVAWVQAAMARPGWDPNAGPEFDFVFMLGLLLRAFFINLALLPLALFAAGWKVRSRRRPVLT